MSIEIFAFEESDLKNMSFNQYGKYLDECQESKIGLLKYLNKAHAYTICDNLVPMAILGFDEYERGCFDGCIIASDMFERNWRYAFKMRWLVQTLRVKMKMKRVQTSSEDCKKLNRWHEFLGFKQERKMPKMFFGKDYILWSM